MIGHQRDILASLGIDLWIPRAAVCQSHQTALWRDQAATEILPDLTLINRVPVALEKPVITPAPVQRSTVFVGPQAAPIEHVPTAPLDVDEQLEIPPFVLQALSLPHCSIVMDATQVTEQQQQLWANIQRAMAAEFYELQWPFAWLNLQDGRGVGAYIQGFIDAISTDKHVIVLGQIPHILNDKTIVLASLQEMLDQPLLKKRLWQFMQNKPPTRE